MHGQGGVEEGPLPRPSGFVSPSNFYKVFHHVTQIKRLPRWCTAGVQLVYRILEYDDAWTYDTCRVSQKKPRSKNCSYIINVLDPFGIARTEWV
jgi:hypothetical protein